MKGLRKKFRRQKGFSLPEILVSCMIGLIGICAILGSFLSGRLSSTGARHYTQAMNLTRARIEYLKSLRYADLSSRAGVAIESNLPLDERDRGTSIPCTRFTTVRPEEGGITIAVMVSWNEKAIGAGSTPWTYQVRTWVAFPGPPVMAGG